MNAFTYKTLFAPAARTSTANGTGIDITGYVDDIEIILANNTTSGTTPTLDVKIQDSADNSTYADVTGLTFTQVTAALTDPVGLKIPANTCRQYIRAVATIGGTTPSFLCSVTAQLKKKYS
jgi:hypothetical protein